MGGDVSLCDHAAEIPPSGEIGFPFTEVAAGLSLRRVRMSDTHSAMSPPSNRLCMANEEVLGHAESFCRLCHPISNDHKG